ncbi:unnamed protein product [Plutella xylostella]|uniref:(diamondback moth) hypothetical protein n=1 Tax=Plutella xylostella TaxID=51655 RepID=A0A8S4FH19_PLUXY|nr:unnamed protein product [Plutella xylostella]
MYTEYDSIQCDLENLSPIPDEQYKERELFEAEYYRAVAAAREVVDSGSAEGVHASSVSGSGETVVTDPSFHIPAPIDMLLGADIFWDVLGANHINLGKNNPSLHETKFGWLISGSIQKIYNKQSNTVHCHFLSDNKVQEQLSRFFELESVSPSHSMSKVERECEEHFIKTTKRDSEGRFIVTIPLKDSPEKLGDSYQQALTRFLSLERRFDRDPNFKTLYSQFMNEYIDMGHMTKNENFNPNTNTTGYFYPHHGILRESSLTTRLRCVFDASMPSSSGLSFNSIQMVGPTVQDDLVSILLRFRQHKIVVSSDIAKMYRMVLVTEEQRNLQQILWRSEPSEPIQIYNLNTVTYGTASAPYLATRCIVQLGKECDDKAVSEAILKDFYVDDWLSGADSEEELIHICKGRTLTMLPYPINTEPSTSYLPRHKRVEQMKLHFWNRYYKEYITELQTRQKWRKDGEQLQNGDMVLVKDDRLPPNKWLLGRITNVYPGTDGIARVADILTTSGTIRRAFNRLCLLPMLEQDVPRPGLC